MKPNPKTERLLVARDTLRGLVEGIDHLTKEDVLRVWPTGVPALKPEAFPRFLEDDVLRIEAFVTNLCERHDWVKITPTQIDQVDAMMKLLDDDSRVAVDFWANWHDIPNLRTPGARLVHWKRSMAAIKSAQEGDEVSG